MSALPPEADIRQRIEHVCSVPLADISRTRVLDLLTLISFQSVFARAYSFFIQLVLCSCASIPRSSPPSAIAYWVALQEMWATAHAAHRAVREGVRRALGADSHRHHDGGGPLGEEEKTMPRSVRRGTSKGNLAPKTGTLVTAIDHFSTRQERG